MPDPQTPVEAAARAIHQWDTGEAWEICVIEARRIEYREAARAALEAAIEALEEPVELEATDFVLHGGYDPRQYVFHTRPVKEPVKVATIDKSALRRAFGLEETGE